MINLVNPFEGRRKIFTKQDLLESLRKKEGSQISCGYEELLFIAGDSEMQMTIDVETRSGDSWYNILGKITIDGATRNYETGLYASEWARLRSKLGEREAQTTT